MIFGYIKDITLITLFLALVDMILPSQKFTKYIQLVLGFILMVNIILPFIDFKEYSFSLEDFDIENFAYSEFDNQEFVEASTNMDNQAISQGVKTQIISENQLENYVIQDVLVNYEMNGDIFNFTSIDIKLSEKNENIAESGSEVIEPIRIDKISIDGVKKEEVQNFDENEEIKNLKNKISQSYNMSIDSINVNIENY